MKHLSSMNLNGVNLMQTSSGAANSIPATITDFSTAHITSVKIPTQFGIEAATSVRVFVKVTGKTGAGVLRCNVFGCMEDIDTAAKYADAGFYRGLFGAPIGSNSGANAIQIPNTDDDAGTKYGWSTWKNSANAGTSSTEMYGPLPPFIAVQLLTPSAFTGGTVTELKLDFFG